MFSYQQVAVTAETDSRALHPLEVNVGALGLHVPEAALQRALLGEQWLQPEERQQQYKKNSLSTYSLFINLKLHG